jgi:valyl-tRNA synthetase
VESLQRLVTEVRRFRNDQGVKPGQRVVAALDFGGSPLAPHEEGIRALLRLTEPGEGFSATASLPVEDVTVRLDTAGVIDVAAERRRLEKDLAAARKEAAQTAGKLGNEAFMAKAPEQVVAKNRDRLAAAEADIERLVSQLAALPAA